MSVIPVTFVVRKSLNITSWGNDNHVMNQHHHTPRARTAAAKHSPSALPFLLFVLFLFFLSDQANAQGDSEDGEVRWEHERSSHEEALSALTLFTTPSPRR